MLLKKPAQVKFYLIAFMETKIEETFSKLKVKLK